MANTNLHFIFLQLKICMLNVFFWLKLLLLVMIIFLTKQISSAAEDDSLVLLCNSGSEYADDVISEIISSDYDGIKFAKSNDSDSVISSVTKCEAVCAVIFTDDFDRAVKKGKMSDCVKYYQSSSSIDGYAVKEVIFPYLLEAISNTLIKNYITSNSSDVSEESLEYVTSANDMIIDGMNISIFKLENSNTDSASHLFEPNRPYCIALWLIFAVALIDVFSSFETLKPLLLAKTRLYRMIYALESSMINTALISLAVGLIFFTDSFYIFLLYGICCSLYSFLLKSVIRSNKIYSVLIPILIIICLLICPILYDFSVIIPGIGYLNKLVPITYFSLLL